ncbi:MAG: histidine phosphatase family protein [Bacilli bacterium]
MRARDTAKEITDNDIIIDQRLIERDYGLNEEMPIEDANPKELWDYDLNYGDHQGETVQEILNRVHILLEDLKNKYQDRKQFY